MNNAPKGALLAVPSLQGAPWLLWPQVDKSGTKFVTVSKDRRVRVFKFKTGKLMRTYDESLEVGWWVRGG